MGEQSKQSNDSKWRTVEDPGVNLSCSSIKALSPDISNAWEGYKPDENIRQREILGPIFVVVVKRKMEHLYEKISHMGTVRIIQRLAGEVSVEAKQCLQMEANLSFSLAEHNKIRNTLLQHSEDLMKSHSNLQMVSASKLKSQKQGKWTVVEPCIVMYVHVKGVIPVNETAFPKTIGGFPVDVREGVFTNYSDPQLAIGSTIRGKDSCGKIAGFVHLPNGNIGCLTCAHLFCIHEDMEVDDTETAKEDVFQLSPSPSSTPFGQLCKREYDPGGPSENGDYKIGVDAALIEITDRLRYPMDGNYKSSVSPSVVCDGTLDYHSGEILTSSEEVARMYINNNMKCKIVRYDEKRGKMYARTGRINVDGASVRLNAWFPPTKDEPCQLYAQIHIQPDPNEVIDIEDQSFATFGDSGSLVFLTSDTREHLWAFGMVVGGFQADGSAIVTPIWAVLDAFGLPRNFVSFKWNQFNELSEKVDKMDLKMTQMDVKMNQMDAKMNQMDAKMNQIDVKMNQMDGTMNQMDVKVNHIDQTMNQMHRMLSILTAKDNASNRHQNSHTSGDINPPT